MFHLQPPNLHDYQLNNREQRYDRIQRGGEIKQLIIRLNSTQSREQVCRVYLMRMRGGTAVLAPITAFELRLQGLPVENFDMSAETQAQLQDLGDTATMTTVVGAVILAGLSAIARGSGGEEAGGRTPREREQVTVSTCTTAPGLRNSLPRVLSP